MKKLIYKILGISIIILIIPILFGTSFYPNFWYGFLVGLGMIGILGVIIGMVLIGLFFFLKSEKMK